MTASAGTAAERPAKPYPGLRPFEGHEWSIFFGRERMVDEVIDRLAEHGLVLIHGASGSGKSSLVRAGILPKLARQHRRHGTPWLTCAMRPSGGPLWNLATELARLEGREDDVARIGAIHGQFTRRDVALADIAATIDGAAGKSLCILVDQFEELFRFEKETSREEAELFVELIARVAAAGTVHVVVTMRSEFLGECARFAGFAETINRTQYLVPRLDDEALLRAVRRPAQLYHGVVGEALAERLIARVRGREDELPLLQHALMLMWDARDTAQKPVPLDGAMVEAAGGLAELLSAHADKVMASVAPDARRERMVEILFRELTDVNAEGSAIRRPRKLADLAAVVGASPEELRPIVEAFRAPGVSFLTPYAPAPITEATVIDISHEALIRCWRRIASGKDCWLKREFDDGLAWRSLLVEAVAFERDAKRVLPAAAVKDRGALYAARSAPWCERYGGGWAQVGALLEASRRSAARSRRAAITTMSLLAGLLLGASGLAYFGFTEWRQARTQNELGRMVFDRLTEHNSSCPKSLTVDQVFMERARATADQGNSGAYFLLGITYYCGNGISTDYVQARIWWEKAALAGDADAMRDVGMLYRRGQGVAQDYGKAREWYELAAAVGNANAMTSLGLLYANGQGVRQDYVKARQWYEKAAASGDRDAMNSLGVLHENGRGTPRDYVEARKWYEKSAASGGSDAMYNLGLMYANGHGLPRDYAKAREWYQKAADLGDRDAMSRLGIIYANGQGTPQNYSLALNWYDKAAAAGSSDAMYYLGWMYSQGQGVPQDYGKARKWYEKSAAAGDRDAMRSIGLLYGGGKGVRQDYAKAREWFEKAAAAGNRDAMNDIGLLYQNGHGVRQDYVEARKWYEKAVAAGNDVAMTNLALIYEDGQGVRQDYAEARALYEQAVAAGNSGAMYNLAVLHVHGRGGPRDYVKARALYEKAAAAGDRDAMRNIGSLYSGGQGVRQDYVEARGWYEKAAAAGSREAMNDLGILYENGRGVKQDYAKARAWYEKAAAAGNPISMYNLGSFYYYGQGVRQDYSKARDWYEKAAAAGDPDATRNVGIIYEDGRGVKQDYAKAREWLEKAAAIGSRDAMNDLGLLYENGRGVRQDYATARGWYEKAAAAGNAVAMNNLGALYADGHGVRQDYAEARTWYEKAAAAGNVNAMDNLSVLYATGKGVRKDYSMARRWLEKAVEAGNAEARLGLSWVQILTHDFAAALATAEKAHELDPGDLAVETNHAHALMFLGREIEAMALYMANWGKPVPRNDGKLWQVVVAEDFAEFRKAGLDAPFMKKVEAAFTAKATPGN